jgi:apolipoprotein N-acyltransferase
VRQAEVRKLAFSLVAGALLATGGPPFDVLPALWLGMAALAWLLDEDPAWPPFASRARVALTGARRGIFFGIGANLVALRFIPDVVTRFTPLPWVAGALGLVLLAAFEASRWGLAAVVCHALGRRGLPRPFALSAGVYVGTFVPTMIPWTPAGGASPWPSMVQLADVLGERGVAALMALVAGLLATGARKAMRGETRRRGWFTLGAGVAVLAAQAAVGKARMASIDRARDAAPHAAVGLVQPSIGASTRWEQARAPDILSELRALTRRAESRGAQLVVWSEAVYPYPIVHGTRAIADPTRAVIREGVRGPVLTGAVTSGADDGASYNSAVLVGADGGMSPSYDKRHLLWFGETVPLADHFPWLRHVFARGLGLAAGTREVAFIAGPVRAAVLICYEDTLPEAGREAAEVAPNLLVNVTNDAWFAGGPESELHLRVAALRAVELRRDMVRAVNFGPTSWVDAAGRVRARTLPDVPSVLAADPALLDAPPTLYARFGDIPCAAGFAVYLGCMVWRARRRH